MPTWEPNRDPRLRYEIWVSCDDCGDVVVAGEACELIRAETAVRLAYLCVQCGRRSVTSVPDDELASLLAKGFSITEWRAPLELREPRPVGPPWTWDDLLDAHELLARTHDVVGVVELRRCDTRAPADASPDADGGSVTNR